MYMYIYTVMLYDVPSCCIMHLYVVNYWCGGGNVGHGDVCYSQQHVGCLDLLSTIQGRVKPTFHVFGHVHEGTC